MRDYYQVRINFKGGIASPGNLRELLTIARSSNVHYVRFGSRQQLLMTVHYEDMRTLESAFRTLGVVYEYQTDNQPNVVSSYCGEEVFRTGQWLSASEYHSVLDTIDFTPRLKINLSDANQSFTPFFTGNINFISSPEPHFWYVYVRPRQSNQLFRWRDQVYSNDVGRTALAIEAMLLEKGKEVNQGILDELAGALPYISQPVSSELELPSFSLPYYEGFNRYESRTWLGLYRRDEQFPVEFLMDLCAQCLKNRIGEICLTPWKSLIIKNILEENRGEWSYIIGKHNINVRHAASELAWQTEDHAEEGNHLKYKLIRYLERNDTRTFGLCFGIQTKPKSEVFGSVLIRRRPVLSIAGWEVFHVYDLLHTDQFNPNSRQYVPFETGLFRMHLGPQLERLCRKFSNQKTLREKPIPVTQEEKELSEETTKTVLQCPDCLTIYDSDFGDPDQGIPAGTAADALPEAYCCGLCGNEKEQLILRPVEVRSQNILA